LTLVSYKVPLAEIEPERIRSIEADEEEWLFLARMGGVLDRLVEYNE
jgi:hypothetical protein